MKESDINPYQSPTENCMVSLEPAIAEVQSRPAYKLYSVWSVTLASILGSCFAGGVIMAINYKRLGRFAEAIHSIFWTLAGTIAICSLGLILPDDIHIPNSFFLVPQILAMCGLTKSLQGPAINEHLKKGGAMASAWGAAGISILIGIILAMIIFGISMFLAE